MRGIQTLVAIAFLGGIITLQFHTSYPTSCMIAIGLIAAGGTIWFLAGGIRAIWRNSRY